MTLPGSQRSWGGTQGGGRVLGSICTFTFAVYTFSVPEAHST